MLGHSYGGAVIADAGVRPGVRHLVYLSAFPLAEGEACTSRGDRTRRMYRRHLARRDVQNLGHAMVQHDDGTSTTDPRRRPRVRSTPTSTTRRSTRASARLTPQLNASLVRGAARPSPGGTRPSTYVVCADDQGVHPELQRIMATPLHRAGRVAGRPFAVRQPAGARRRAARRPRPPDRTERSGARSGAGLLPYCIVAGSMSLGYGSIYTFSPTCGTATGSPGPSSAHRRRGLPRRLRRPAALARLTDRGHGRCSCRADPARRSGDDRRARWPPSSGRSSWLGSCSASAAARSDPRSGASSSPATPRRWRQPGRLAAFDVAGFVSVR